MPSVHLLYLLVVDSELFGKHIDEQLGILTYKKQGRQA